MGAGDMNTFKFIAETVGGALIGVAIGLLVARLVNKGWLIPRKPKAPYSLPEFLPILQELAQAWGSLNDEDIDRCERNMAKPSPEETKLGVLHSQEARRTMALSTMMTTRAAEAMLYRHSRSRDAQESQFYTEQAARFKVLAECLSEMFWAQAKDDIGGQAWTCEALGIRSGWMVVETKVARPDFLKLFGGSPQ